MRPQVLQQIDSLVVLTCLTAQRGIVHRDCYRNLAICIVNIGFDHCHRLRILFSEFQDIHNTGDRIGIARVMTQYLLVVMYCIVKLTGYPASFRETVMRIAVMRVDQQRFSVASFCFLKPSEIIEGSSHIDMGVDISRINAQRLLEVLQRLLRLSLFP